MEFGLYHIQIFVSLALILGASLVALICDYLKGKNEKLRELTVELQVRREESEKLLHLLTAKDSPLQTPVQASGPEPVRDLSRAEAPSADAEADLPERKRLSADAMVAIVRGARKAGVRRAVPATGILQEVVMAADSSSRAKVQIKTDWNTLLTAQEAAKPREQPKPVRGVSGLLDAVMAATASSAESGAAEAALPSGWQDAAVLQELAASGRKISGLAVSIGVTSQASSVRSRVEALLEAGDFAAPRGESEFVLLCPAVHGASAQRRLSRVSQQLWGAQLGSLGQSELQYAWGGLEVHGETIQEAVASAVERMQESRHSRSLLTLTASPAASAAV